VEIRANRKADEYGVARQTKHANRTAQALYESLGYVHDAGFRAYYFNLT